MQVIVQKWEESERGWGTRPDGYSIHLSEADRIAYIQEHNAALPTEVPDEYDRPCGSAYEAEINEADLHPEALARLKSGDRHGLRFFDNKYPGHGGVNGWIGVTTPPKDVVR